MITTSTAYDTAIQATIRKFRGRCEVTWVDSDIDLTIVVTANDYNRINDAAEVPSGNENLQHAADGRLVPSFKYAHLDQDIIADGTFHPFPGTVPLSVTYEAGWWGKTECNSNGLWIDSAATTTTSTTTLVPAGVNPILTVTFAARLASSLLITGDSQYNEYPLSFIVRIYDEVVGGNLLRTETVTDSIGTDWIRDGVTWRKTLPDDPDLYSCRRMELEVVKWSRAFRVVKIVEFYTSVVKTYDGDDIISMKFLEEMLISDGSLPVGNISANELDIKLQNVEDQFFVGNTGSSVYEMIKRNRRIRAWIGLVLPPYTTPENIEWIPLGVFWSGDWQADELGTYVSTSARDRMELLRKAQFKVSGLYENITLYDLAVIVMENALLEMSDLEYSVDISLDSITLEYAWFEKVSYFEAIREICEAAQGYAYCDRYGVVQIMGNV